MLQWHSPEGISGKIFRLQLNRNTVSAVFQGLKGFEILLIFRVITNPPTALARKAALHTYSKNNNRINHLLFMDSVYPLHYGLLIR